jgi:hypothetical protein
VVEGEGKSPRGEVAIELQDDTEVKSRRSKQIGANLKLMNVWECPNSNGMSLPLFGRFD